MKARTKLFCIAVFSASLIGQLSLDIAQSKFEGAQQSTSNMIGQFGPRDQPGDVVVAGTVTDEKGALLKNLPVILEYERQSFQTNTDEFGKYKFDRVNPSLDYALIVRYNTTAGSELSKFKEVKITDRITTVNLQLTVEATPTPAPSPRPVVTPKPTPLRHPTPVSTPVSSPTPQPSPVGTDWEAMIRSEEQKLRTSKIVFNPPTEMQQEKTEIIQARIPFDEDVGPALTQGLQGGGTPQEAPLMISDIMVVTLTGDGNAFLITKIGNEEKIVGKPYAEWEWHVTPLQAGEQRLTLTATARIFLQGRGEKSIDIKTLRKPITVHVNRWHVATQFVANNWQWLWAVLIVPAGGLFWRHRRKKARPAGFR